MSILGIVKPPNAAKSARTMQKELKSLAIPFAVEMITKGLVSEDWKKHIPFYIIEFSSRGPEGGLPPDGDARVRDLVLWCVGKKWEDREINRVIQNACIMLATEELLQEAAKRAQQAETPELKKAYEQAADKMRYGLLRAHAWAAAATQPATRPAVPPFLEFDPKTQKFVTKPGHVPPFLEFDPKKQRYVPKPGYVPPHTQPATSSQPAGNP